MKWDEMGSIGLIGKYEHSIDSNGRLSIPAKFREYITAYSEGSVVMTMAPGDSCIVVYPLPEWHAITQRASQQMEPAAGEPRKDFLARKDFLRVLYSRAADSELDKQGRILIPASLREYAELDKDVVVLGRYNVFEIWDVKKWQQKDVQVLEDKKGLEEAMAGLGI